LSLQRDLVIVAGSIRSPLLVTSRQVDGTGPRADCAPSLRCLRSSRSRTRAAGAYIGVRMVAPPLSLPLQLELKAPAVGAVQCVVVEHTLVAAAQPVLVAAPFADGMIVVARGARSQLSLQLIAASILHCRTCFTVVVAPLGALAEALPAPDRV
jgi:hypothetical protein